MNSPRRVIVLLATLLLAAACTDDGDWRRSAPVVDSGADELEQLEQLVDGTAAAEDVPGVLVGVRWPDGAEWIHAAGVRDLSTGVAMDPETQWPARSITKSFTITALLRLEEDGDISLDDTIDRYVDGVPGGDEVTLAQMALMTSGLPDYTNERFAAAFVEDPARVFEDSELLAFVEGEALEAEPGAEHRYINTNTLVLGMALAEVTGATVGEVLDRVTEPLGLDATRYRPAPGSVDAPTGYQPDGASLAEVPLTFGVFGAAGAMATDLDDLLSWGEALGRGTGLEPGRAASRTEAAAPLLDGPEYDRYGLGIGELDGWWGHTGEGLGYSALVMNHPASGTTVAIFANVSNLEGGHVPTQLFRLMVPLLERSV